MTRNHQIQTRRITKNHYQIIIVHVQSGKCLKVLADAVRDPEMNQTEFESYIEGMYQRFMNPVSFFDQFDIPAPCPICNLIEGCHVSGCINDTEITNQFIG